jgi:cytochrome c oxidase cbb3-type subunit III
MTEFTSGFWSWYIIAISLGGIAYCAWLLWSTSRIRVKVGPAGTTTAGGKVETTGHVWDGDLAEFNNPLPRWWMWLFWITIAFGLVYLVIYPGLGSFPGIAGWTSFGSHAKEVAEADAKLKPMYDKYAAMSIPDLAANKDAHAIGERIFLNNCAQCHGSDARGATGFPNLTDNDWLYGGTPEAIETSIAGGRNGVMPPQAAALGGAEGVKNVVAYVRSLSGLPHDSLNAQIGKQAFMTICAACHGPDGKGNQAIGAPNLTDNVWLYGSSEAVITETVTKGRGTNTLSPGQSVMPAWKETLGPARVHLVAAYVWSFSNKPAAAK